MPAGRPPKPKALHLLKGTFREDRHGKRDGGINPPVGAEMPDLLLGDPVAVKYWNKWAPVLTSLGVLTQIDSITFGRLCRLWAEEEGRTKMLDPESGLRLPSDPRLLSEIRQIEERFGMNPSARVKLKTEPTKPKTKLEKFRAG